MLSFIYSVLVPCFKSLNNTKLNSLSKAIACVALGLRTSHLLDITLLDLNQAKFLLKHLRKVKLQDHLSVADKLIYIAVQGTEPVKLNVPPQLIYWLDQLNPFLSKPNQTVFYSDIVPTCMVSIIGWALEYPIVYTTHLPTDQPQDELDEWETRTNCLGARQLQLVQLWLADHMLLSYSYPIISDLDNLLDLQAKVNHRLTSLKNTHWLNGVCCELKREQIKLDRFAL
ncbi:hypothetical protein HPULCUR_007001 [Helicostylum pulchrum]|uniref:Uncharacterized protein n=1 Tax=Helicostylum pulchrum TaxID=562976 RepID=A0ABP9Y3H6_9FUNG